MRNDMKKWLIEKPVIENLLGDIILSSIEKNSSFQYQSGMQPKIVRRSSGRCCEWCDRIAGTYSYPNVPQDVYRRHKNCDCTVDYYPGDGKKQDVWTKKWSEDKDILEQRKKVGLDKPLKKNPEEITKTINSATNYEELESYLRSNYNIDIDDSIYALDFDSVKEGVQGIDKVFKEFPQAKNSFTKIGTRKEGIMCAGYGGDINFNPAYYISRSKAVSASQSTGFHPKGNNVISTGAHEAGHLLEKALIDKEAGVAGKIFWREGTFAKAVVSEACKAAKKTLAGKGKTNGVLKKQVSGYATTNDSECLAEAVADYVLNGKKASILSKKIWEILKRELG